MAVDPHVKVDELAPPKAMPSPQDKVGNVAETKVPVAVPADPHVKVGVGRLAGLANAPSVTMPQDKGGGVAVVTGLRSTPSALAPDDDEVAAASLVCAPPTGSTPASCRLVCLCKG